jgi:hypothetical protein
MNLIAHMHEGGVTVELTAGIGVIGAEWHGGVNTDCPQVRGVLIGPNKCPPLIYANSGPNIDAAIGERVNKKGRPYTGTAADRRKIGKFIQKAMSECVRCGIWSKSKIHRWCELSEALEHIKSGKWGDARFWKGVDMLLGIAYPKYTFKAGVKAEPMPEGKAPRLLIADGDAGQLMALITVACFESLLFDHMEKKSIKHCPKKVAMARVVIELTKRHAGLVEGDGSAWDTTCNEDVRKAENTILFHIGMEVAKYGIAPTTWTDAHQVACTAPQLKLEFMTKVGLTGRTKLSFYIDAIRRSGHRGTSCLNWFVNFLNWVCSIFQEPEQFLDPLRRSGKDVTGKMRWWNGVFEGDDSLCALYPKMVKGDALSVEFEAWWARQGFNMKLIYVDTRATFTGWHIACDQGTPNGCYAPELARSFVSAGVSCSPTAIEAAMNGDEATLKNIAAASYVARSYDFAGVYPTVSKKYLEYGLSLQADFESDREMSMRCTGKEGARGSDLVREIEMLNCGKTPDEELIMLAKMGVPASHEQLWKFRDYGWMMSEAMYYDEFMDSLPPSWR